MNTFLATRAFAAIVLVCVGGAASARSTSAPIVITNATLVPADDVALAHDSTTTTDAAIYRSYSADYQLAGDPLHPQLGAAITFPGSGPQVRISGLHVYLYSRTVLVQQRVLVTVQLWDKYLVSTPDKAVFSKGPPMSQIAIDLHGPYNLEANKGYRIDAVLPKPLLLSGYQNKGLVVQVLASTGFNPPVAQTDLVPAYDIGNAAIIGTLLASYANDGTQEFNFRGDENVTGEPLAIQLDGAAQKLTQCSSWSAGYRDHFIEEFATQISPRWKFDLNNGTADQDYTIGGSLALHGANTGFPYVRLPNAASPTQPIPSSGEFSVRWLAKYNSVSGSGDGSLVISAGLPNQGDADNLQPRAAWVWQDSSQGFHAKVKTDYNTPNPAAAFQESAGTSSVHDIEYCWLDSTVELWVDGARVFNQARNANVPRPDSLWIGNHTGIGSSDWNDVEVFRVHVRKPNPADALFYDTFE